MLLTIHPPQRLVVLLLQYDTTVGTAYERRFFVFALQRTASLPNQREAVSHALGHISSVRSLELSEVATPTIVCRQGINALEQTMPKGVPRAMAGVARRCFGVSQIPKSPAVRWKLPFVC